MARARRQPIPVTVVAGPRGAGKTTLINRLIDAPEFANCAVILNDFGAAPLKGGIVEQAAEGFIALGSGCICCSVRGALTDGLEKLIRDLDNGRLAAIGRVAIEADETADPGAIFAAIVRHPYLSMRFRPDGVIAVLDAATVPALLAARADTVGQVAAADVIALTGGQVTADAFAGINSRAAVVDAATVPAKAVIGHGPFDGSDIDAWLGSTAMRTSAPRSGEAERIFEFSAVRPRPMPIAAIDQFVDYLMALQGPNLIRVRGAVGTEEGGTVIVEGMSGFFHPPLMVDGADADGPATRFSVVARDFDRVLFEGYLDAFLNEVGVDTPDRAALTANPLAIAGFSARGR